MGDPVEEAMERAAKAKTGLEEIRMLTLGIQVLIGFQMQGCFQPQFERLSLPFRVLQMAGLVVLLACLGLLLVPATQHQIVERHEGTPRLERLITICLNYAGVGVALVLGADVLQAVGRIGTTGIGVTTGLLTSLTALVFWVGWPYATRRSRGQAERNMASKRATRPTPLPEKIDQMLTEARTILPGAQALLGFQLTVVMTEAFDKLAKVPRVTHIVALLFVTLTVMLLMAPAALHRIVYAGEDTEHVLNIGSRFVVGATLPLAAAVALDSYVVAGKALGSETLALGLGAISFLALVALWWIYPLAVRRVRAVLPR